MNETKTLWKIAVLKFFCKILRKTPDGILFQYTCRTAAYNVAKKGHLHVSFLGIL